MVLPNRLKHSDIQPLAADSNQGLQRALAELSRAEACGRSGPCRPWQFAVELDRLLAAGLTTSDLRWLVKRGFVEHAHEVTGRYDKARRFKSCGNTSFDRRTCFLLTDNGAALAAAQRLRLPPADATTELGLGTCRAAGAVPEASNPRPTVPKAAPVRVPSWDANRRELYWDGRLVKQFKVPSPTQEALLAAFEEEGWPAAIDDPLPPISGQDPKCRMRNTIRHLNANQKDRLLYFRGDGSGQRILWELAEEAADERSVPARLSFHAA
jgi:hypothetical protein